MYDDYDKDVRLWLPNAEQGWVGATVTAKSVSAEGALRLNVKTETGEELELDFAEADLKSGKKQLPPLRNPPILESTEDLTTLSYLNEPAVLHAIKARYAQLSIYTFSGIVLIATNPFDRMDNLYTPEVIQTYSGRQRGELEPHLFSIAEDAYRAMIRDNRNQTIVVSGESGAGKTVSAKYIMRYFATVDDPDHPRKTPAPIAGGSAAPGKTDLSEVEREILATNPIMEAFGNAKTTRNDNSSRFGKYLELQFNTSLEIVGARIRTYLLERSRIVFHQSTERNYHIFYQLVRGATPEESTEFGLDGGVTTFHFLNQGDPDIADVDDAADFQGTRDALSIVGVDGEKQHQIFQVLAALLHLGNTHIKEGRNNATVSSQDDALVKACQLLGVEPSELAKWFTKKVLKTGAQKIQTDLDYKTALVVRDSVAKYVYSTMFDWLVASINRKLMSASEDAASFIGVLDIYGFEHFKTNSFEQFCINYANEKLQQEFNQHVFKLEQEEYEKEEINWTYIDFSDNQPAIDLIENKLGILSLLDDESRLPAGTDEGFASKLYSTFGDNPKQKFFKKPRFGQSAFVVRHYAMEVSYETDGFVEKNRDTVPDEIVEVLNATTNPFLKEIFDDAASANAAVEAAEAQKAAAAVAAAAKPGPQRGGPMKKARKPTLGNIFKNSLIDLMATINSTNAHYIRCIKPNEEKQAWKFDGPMVLSQLRACGVLETIRISSAGFPSRWPYEEFAERYEMLLHSSERKSADAIKICESIIKHAIPDEDKYQLGKSKIFFRAGMLARLEKMRTDRQSAAAIQIQKILRMLYYRRRFEAAIASVHASQALARGHLARLRAEHMRQTAAATRLQANYRGLKERRSFNTTRTSVVTLQASIRGLTIRRNLLEKQRRDAATQLQAALRGHAVRQQYKRNFRSIELVQSMVRRRGARRELQRLREDRNSAAHLKQEHFRLENKMVSMQNALSQFKSENAGLNEALAALKGEHAALNTSLAEALASHKKASDEFETTRAASTAQFEALNNDHITAQKELQTSRAQVTALQADVAARDEQITNLSEHVESLEKETADLRKQLEEAQHSLAAGPRQMMMAPAPHMQHSQAVGAAARALVGHGQANGTGYETAMYAENIALGDDLEINREIEELLNESPGAREELLQNVIRTLVVPTPKVNDQMSFAQRDVLYPANLANLMTSELWRLGYVEESETLIGSVLRAIQETVQSFKGEAIIPVGAFWISNVHEMYSFYCLAEVNLRQNPVLLHEMTHLELQQYERLMSLAKRDAESLTFNIYHMWMKEIKKLADKMIIPSLIDEQSIPGFHVEEQTRFLSRVFQSGPQYKMDNLILLLTKVHTAMTAFYLEDRYIRQPFMELLTMIGSKAFNDMIMRKNFLSWKRSVQINYNVTRIAEWCKTHGLQEALLPLDRVIQTAKLLQLKKNLDVDAGFIYDICWALTPVQIQKIMLNYTTMDYEEPISSETLASVAQRVKEDKTSSTQLLVDVRQLADSGPFEMVAPRVLQKIEPYIPAELSVPKLHRLTELTSRASKLSEASMQNALVYGGEDEEYEGQGTALITDSAEDGAPYSEAQHHADEPALDEPAPPAAAVRAQ